MRSCRTLEALDISPTPAFHCRFVEAGNKYSVTIQRTKERSALCKAQRLILSATGNQTSWSLAKSVSCNFCSSVRNSADGLVCELHEEVEVFAFRFASNFLLPHFSILPTSSSPIVPLFLPYIYSRKIRHALRFPNVPKPPDLDGISTRRP